VRYGRRLLALGLSMLVLVLATAPASGLIIGTTLVQGRVLDAEDAPLEGVAVRVVGMEEYNTTTDVNGTYTMVVPFLEAGHTLRFTLAGFVPKDVPSGPLVEDGHATVNTTLATPPPRATLHVVLLPWSQMGTNYGLRMDYIHVDNASGTPFFEFSEKTSEADVTVPAPGTYQVTGTRPGYYPVTVTVSVDRGDRLDVDLDMSQNKIPTLGTVNGTVEHRGEPLANVTVVAEPEEGSRTYQAVTDAEGGFSMDLPDDNYSIRVELEGYARLSQGVNVDVGETEELYFPMSVAKETGDEGSPLLPFLVAAIIVVVLAVIIGYAYVTSRRNAAAEEAERSRTEELRCPDCDAVAPADGDRCSECGTVFPWKSFRCPDCGAVMGLDAKRCPECGNETFDLHGG
jgi:hypothetical protein